MTTVTEEICSDILEINVSSIQSIRRLRKRSPTRNHPIVFTVVDYRVKVKIAKHCSNLKDKVISISGDYYKRVVEIRKKASGFIE